MTASLKAYSASPKDAMILLGDGGIYTRNSIPRKSKWLGLFCKNLDCRLSDAQVVVGSSTSEGAIGEEKTDIFHAFGNPIAIFTGLDIPEKEIKTWFLANENYFDDPPYKSLKSFGSWKMPWGSQPLTISWVKLPESAGFRYHISDGTSKQFIFRTETEGHYGGDTTPNIIWVGDMDGDNKIDIILSTSYDCSLDMRLYLSSSAASPAFLKKAAHFSGGMPACGC